MVPWVAVPSAFSQPWGTLAVRSPCCPHRGQQEMTQVVSCAPSCGASGTITVGKAGTTFFPYYTQAANKTLEFNNLEVTYNYETRELSVLNASGQEMSFNEEELTELKAALVQFGIGIAGTGTEYR